MNKTTLVLGASLKPERYSHLAIQLLRSFNHKVYALGTRRGTVSDVEIVEEHLNYNLLDTITLYINPKVQEDLYSYIISLHPRRIIFNPGTENEELKNLAEAHGIECVEACTLVLLKTNQY
ncbi:MAG: CoA-binding protein [Saprospiraceae bacterium]|nr:CoA-binding protein [Saprospiraceae bacterium]